MFTSFWDGIVKLIADGLASVMGLVVRAFFSVPTPVLDGAGTPVADGSDIPGTSTMSTVLGWVAWIGFSVAIAALIGVAVTMMVSRRNSGLESAGRISVVLVATIIISASAGVIALIVPQVALGSSTVSFMQASLYPVVLIVGVIGLITGAVRLMISGRGEDAIAIVKSLATLAVVSGIGVMVVALLVTASDEFARWIFDQALVPVLPELREICDEACLAVEVQPGTLGDGAILTGAMAGVVGAGFLAAGASQVGFALIFVAVLLVIAALVQVFMMLLRNVMLILLLGVLPVSAAGTLTEAGKRMFGQTAGWLLAFIVYKPAAALVFATAMRLQVESHETGQDPTWVLLQSLLLFCLAIVALPALIRFIAPAAGGMASGAGVGAGLGMAAMAAIPAGAMFARTQMSATSSTATSDPSGSSTTPQLNPSGASNTGVSSAGFSPGEAPGGVPGTSSGASGASGAGFSAGDAPGASGLSGSVNSETSSAASGALNLAGGMTSGASPVVSTALDLAQGVNDVVDDSIDGGQ